MKKNFITLSVLLIASIVILSVANAQTQQKDGKKTQTEQKMKCCMQSKGEMTSDTTKCKGMKNDTTACKKKCAEMKTGMKDCDKTKCEKMAKK